MSICLYCDQRVPSKELMQHIATEHPATYRAIKLGWGFARY